MEVFVFFLLVLFLFALDRQHAIVQGDLEIFLGDTRNICLDDVTAVAFADVHPRIPIPSPNIDCARPRGQAREWPNRSSMSRRGSHLIKAMAMIAIELA